MQEHTQNSPDSSALSAQDSFAHDSVREAVQARIFDWMTNDRSGEVARIQQACGWSGPQQVADALKVRLLLQRDKRRLQVFLRSQGFRLALPAKIALESELLSKPIPQAEKLEVQVTFELPDPSASVDSAAPQTRLPPMQPQGTPMTKSTPQGSNLGLKQNAQKIPGVEKVILVGSGKGGVGKSTVSFNLARALGNQGLKVGILDADIYGPSATMMMGFDSRLGVTEGNRLVPDVASGLKVLTFGAVTGPDAATLWRGPMVAKTLRKMLFQAAWGELDVLVVDLPPGTGDVHIAIMENVQVDGALLVSTPQELALLDAAKAFTMFERIGVPIVGLIENMSMHTCSACGHTEAIFGQDGAAFFCAERGISLLGQLPLSLPIRRAGDQGTLAYDSVEDTSVRATFDRLAEQSMLTCRITKPAT